MSRVSQRCLWVSWWSSESYMCATLLDLPFCKHCNKIHEPAHRVCAGMDSHCGCMAVVACVWMMWKQSARTQYSWLCDQHNHICKHCNKNLDTWWSCNNWSEVLAIHLSWALHSTSVTKLPYKQHASYIPQTAASKAQRAHGELM